MRKLLEKVLCACIIFYRRAVSPHFPSCCRYYPTCSEYALESIKKYGPFKGFALAIARIVRCNPFRKGGYDPVP